MNEDAYRRISYGMTMAIASVWAYLNFRKFVYVSNAGTDSSEYGHRMRVRVEMIAKNDLQKLSFSSVTLFPREWFSRCTEFDQKTPFYRFFYSARGPHLMLTRLFFSNAIVTTGGLGNPVLNGARFMTGTVAFKTGTSRGRLADFPRVKASPETRSTRAVSSKSVVVGSRLLKGAFI